MLDIRKLGLTALALGVIATPAAAQSISEKSNATTGTFGAGADISSRGDIGDTSAIDNTTAAETNLPRTNEFSTFDMDGDNTITQDEFAKNRDENLSLDTFGELDMDQDGTLSEDEFDSLAGMQADTETRVDAETY
jgi:hypothetical protein